MRKIIRKRDKPEYLKPDGTWTREIGEAWIIESIQVAITAVTVYHLEAVELLYLQGERPGKYDFTVALGDAPQDSDPEGQQTRHGS